MDVGLRRLRKALEKILDQLYLEIADAICRDLCIHDAVRPSAKIHGGSSERFVHGHQEIARAQNAAFGAEGGLHRRAESNSHIFHGVMLVHGEIAARVHVEIKRAVPCHQLEHVVEEPDSGSNARLSAPIEIQLQAYVRLVCLAMNRCCSWHGSLSLAVSFKLRASF